MNLDLDHLREVNVKRCNAVFHPEGGMEEWTPAEWAMCVAGEAGEVCGDVKKLKRLDGNVVYNAQGYQEREDLGKRIVDNIGIEIADTIIYLDLLAARLGINLSEVITRKFNLVSHQNNCDITL